MSKIVKNYNGFLLESVKLLLESLMTGSEDLLHVLYRSKGKDNNSKTSEIVNILFTMLGSTKDVKTNFNLLGISDKNDEISFIPDTQYQKGLSDGTDFTNKKKNNTKVGRMIRQLLSDNGYKFTDKEVESFVNSFKASWDSFKGVDRITKIVDGDEILYWYDSNNYATLSGTLGNSCMRMASKNKYMELYSDNDNCKLVVLINSQGLLARALLWKIESNENSYTHFLDRIYASKDSDQEFVSNWVSENIVDNKKNLGSYKAKDGDKVKMRCSLNRTDFEYYPYLDTMYYLYKKLVDGKLNDTGFIANFLDTSYYKDYIVYQLLNTNGTYDEISHRYSKKEDSYILVDNACYINYIEDWSTKSNCYYSKITLTWIPKEDAVWSNAQDDWILKKDSIDHPEYGIVLKSSLVNVIMEYIGNSNNPFEISKELFGISDVDNDIFRIEQMLNIGDDVFRADYTPNGDYKWFSTEIMASDGNNRFFPDFLGFKLYEVVDEDKIPDTLYIKDFGRGYILESASKVFDIEIKNEETYIYYHYVKMMPSVYSNMKKMDNSDVYFKEYSRIITDIHKYMMRTKSDYRSKYSNIIIAESLKIDIYQFLIDLSNVSFKDYLDKRQHDLYEEIEEYKNLDDDRNTTINLLKIFISIFIVSRDGHDAINMLDSYLDKIGKQQDYRFYRDIRYLFEDFMDNDFMDIFNDNFNKAIDKLDVNSQISVDDVDADEFRDYIIQNIDYISFFSKLVY